MDRERVVPVEAYLSFSFFRVPRGIGLCCREALVVLVFMLLVAVSSLQGYLVNELLVRTCRQELRWVVDAATASVATIVAANASAGRLRAASAVASGASDGLPGRTATGEPQQAGCHCRRRGQSG